MTKRELKYILRLNKKNIKDKYSLKAKFQNYKENAYVIDLKNSEYIIYFCKDDGKTEVFRSLFLEDIYEKLCWILVKDERFKALYYSFT